MAIITFLSIFTFQIRLQKEANRRIAELSEKAHSEAVKYVRETQHTVHVHVHVHVFLPKNMYNALHVHTLYIVHVHVHTLYIVHVHVHVCIQCNNAYIVEFFGLFFWVYV